MNSMLTLTELPKGNSKGFLGAPLNLDLDNLDADIVIMGVPYGLPYYPNELSNDQSTAPDILRLNAQDAAWDEPRTLKHFDWDLGGPLLDNKKIKIVEGKSDFSFEKKSKLLIAEMLQQISGTQENTIEELKKRQKRFLNPMQHLFV